jgi:hypothetical protein
VDSSIPCHNTWASLLVNSTIPSLPCTSTCGHVHRRHVGCIVSTTERECRRQKSVPNPTRFNVQACDHHLDPALHGERVCSCRAKQKKDSCSTLNLDSSSRDAYCPCLNIGRPQDQPLTFPATSRCVIPNSTSRTHRNGSAAGGSHKSVDTSAHLLKHVLFVRRLKMGVIYRATTT